eukprot:1908194-Rhodomonas_salina.1
MVTVVLQNCTDFISGGVQNEVAALLSTCFCTVPLETQLQKIKEMAFLLLAVDLETDSVVGVALLESTSDILPVTLPNVYLLQSFCVHPGHRRKGVATAMLNYVREQNIWTVLHVDCGDRHNELVAWYTSPKRQYRILRQAHLLPLDNSVETLL